MDFQSRYKKLNTRQRQAVDTTEGPLLVVAGPGTGKTELLSMRTANILLSTDTTPNAILCLTFTDSGAAAMRKRLTEIIGADAYKVAIHTFHSFGTEVISQHTEYFYRGAQMKPADELTQYEIIREIFDELEYTNPLAGKNGEEYTYLKDTLSAISDIKRSGLTSDELRLVIDDAAQVIDEVETDIGDIFASRVSKKTAELLAPIAEKVSQLEQPNVPPAITPYMNILSLSIAHAVDAALSDDSTKPITAWKKQWCEKNEHGDVVFKDRKAIERLRSIAHIYYEYLRRMEVAELYDYDDMILQVVHALETHPDLAANLREKYLYIMVDEFQDTNLAQLRILFDLTASSESPNIMAVGDDDQGIYSFQGADVSNIHRFRHAYGEPPIIVLTDNYRSTTPILEISRRVILQAENRLENTVDGLDKKLVAHIVTESAPCLTSYASPETERERIAARINNLISHDAKPESIAIIARRHNELVALQPYLEHHGVRVNYERQDNALTQPIVLLVEQILSIIDALHTSEHERADSLLPEILGLSAMGYTPIDVWRLSLAAKRTHASWLETMLTIPTFQPFALWLVDLTAKIHDMPFEEMVDEVIGVPKSESRNLITSPVNDSSERVVRESEQQEQSSKGTFSQVLNRSDRSRETALLRADFSVAKSDDASGEVERETSYTSPIYSYYFSAEKLTENPAAYINALEALRTIRDAMREHSSSEEPSVAGFLDFLATHRELGSTLPTIRHRVAADTGRVNLLTAHKSKGLEYDHVFVLGLVDSAWGERVRTRSKLIRYPANLQIGTPGDSYDERIRLAYVAMTRARRTLDLSFFAADSAGKETQIAGFLSGETAAPDTHTPTQSEQSELAEIDWRSRLVQPLTAGMHELLAPNLQDYKLSATHLGKFLDVSNGGPQTFLIENLLRFPQAKSPSAEYGTAIHTTLQQAHDYIRANHTTQPLEDIIGNFEHILDEHYLSPRDHERFLARGIDALHRYLSKCYPTFNESQRTELSFGSQEARVGEARLTGALDLADIDEKVRTISITDYKTGKPSRDWKGKTEYEKIKLHKYHQQLMFYQLLVENSRDYSKYTLTGETLQFVEPTPGGEIIALENTHTAEELTEFRRLITAVWHCITTLTLPDISDYEPTLSGIKQFESDIIDNYAI